jgi:spore coat protein A
MMTRSASASNGPGVVRSLTPFLDPLPIPPRRVIAEPTRLTVRLQTAMHQYHSGLPPSRVWTYDGHLPGPTIEVRRGVPVEVQWDNRLEGTLPVTVVVRPLRGGQVAVQCAPGRSGGVPDADAWRYPASRSSTCGSLTHATSDGWTENLALPVSRRHHPERPACRDVWYHDRDGRDQFSVYAGLAGVDRARRARAGAGSAEGPHSVLLRRPELMSSTVADRQAVAQDRP